MNALIAYTNTAQVLKLLEWTAELGGVKGHDLILYPFKGLDASQAAEIGRRAFRSVRVEHDSMGVTSNWADQSKGIKDASGPNSMMAGAAWFVYLNKLGPFFFWEPDAIPLVPDWLDRLEAEYKQAGKPFMGAYVPATATGVPAHLTGNAICPENTIELAPSMVLAKQLAFDVAGAAEILPRAHITKQIQHVFYYPDFPSQPTFPDQESLKLIRPDAVLFHRNKDHTAIDRLREKRSGVLSSAPIMPPTLGAYMEHCVQHGEQSLTQPAAKAAEKPRVHTYFRPGQGLDFVEEQKQLLRLWETSWAANGWEPVILTEEDARKNPTFEEYDALFEKLPTANPPGYELACWRRWLCMAQIGGLLTDYDTINVSLGPTVFEHKGRFPTCLRAHVPCAVNGSVAAYQRAVEAFANATDRFVEDGKEHVSDMHLIQKWDWHCLDICKEYKSKGWRSAPLVHFGHYSCGFEKRSAVIERTLKELQSTTDEPVGPLHDAPEVETMASKRRKLIAELKLLSDTPSRKVLTYQELRKQGVIGHPKKRKKQRLVVM